MNEDTVVVFGAGATKACDGPQQADILPNAYDPNLRAKIQQDGFNDLIQREGFADLLDSFLVENFHLSRDRSVRQREDYPALTLLMSLIDIAIDRKQPIGPYWVPDRVSYDQQQNVPQQPSAHERNSLVDVRQSLEYLIFALLEYQLRNIPDDKDYYSKFLRKLYPMDPSAPSKVPSPTVISLNYDIMADNALSDLSLQWWPQTGRFPDYGCEIQTDAYVRRPNDFPGEPPDPRYFGKLLKLHGSLNWIYCPGCHRLDLGIAESPKAHIVKVRETLFMESPLEPRYSCHGSECKECHAFVRPILITPTFLKDYRNPHISRVWYEAERALRQAEHVISVGYSLPDDDVHVIYLLKRGLINPNLKVTVIDYDKDKLGPTKNQTALRYRVLFGDRVVWLDEGFDKYVDGMP